MYVNCVAEVATGIDWSKIWPAILGTVLSVLVTVTLFFIKNNIDKKIREENQRKSEIETLDKQLDDILKIAISYPYLETKKFCDTWDVKKAEEGEDIDKYQRYNVFCNLVFNYLEFVPRISLLSAVTISINTIRVDHANTTRIFICSVPFIVEVMLTMPVVYSLDVF